MSALPPRADMDALASNSTVPPSIEQGYVAPATALFFRLSAMVAPSVRVLPTKGLNTEG